MNIFFKKINLIHTFSSELDISKNDFVKRLENITDLGSTHLFSDFFDSFSNTPKIYRGQVNNNGFKIKKRNKFLDPYVNLAKAEGSFKETDNKLIIETEVNGFSYFFIFFYILLIFTYVIFIFNFDDNVPLFAVFFLLIHAFFMFTIPYIFMKRNVQSLEYLLEREFYYLSKQ